MFTYFIRNENKNEIFGRNFIGKKGVILSQALLKCRNVHAFNENALHVTVKYTLNYN